MYAFLNCVYFEIFLWVIFSIVRKECFHTQKQFVRLSLKFPRSSAVNRTSVAMSSWHFCWALLLFEGVSWLFTAFGWQIWNLTRLSSLIRGDFYPSEGSKCWFEAKFALHKAPKTIFILSALFWREFSPSNGFFSQVLLCKRLPRQILSFPRLSGTFWGEFKVSQGSQPYF